MGLRDSVYNERKEIGITIIRRLSVEYRTILVSRLGGSAKTKFANRFPVPSNPGSRINAVEGKPSPNYLVREHFTKRGGAHDGD